MQPLSTLQLLASGAVLCAQAACSTPAHAQAKPVGESTAVGDALGGYYAITSDVRRCAFPACGGWFLKQLNQPTTTCHDGRTADRCYTPVLDWTDVNVPEPQRAELLDAARTGTTTGHVTAIVRGAFASTNAETPRPELGRFIIGEAWVADGDGAAQGTFVHVVDNGLRCFAPPCTNLTEQTLNTSQVTDSADVDFESAGLSDTEIAEYTALMYGSEGIVVAGDRYTVQNDGRTASGRTATQVYRPLGTDSTP